MSDPPATERAATGDPDPKDNRNGRSERSPRSGRYILIAAAAVCGQTAAGVILNGLSMVADSMIADLWPDGSRTRAQVLTYYTLLLMVSIAAMPVAGRLIGRVGGRLLLIVGGAITTLGLVIMSMAQGMGGLYVAGAITGLGLGTSVNYVPVVLVNSWFERFKSPVMGVVMAGTGLGGILTSIMFPYTTPPVDEGGLGWRVSLLLAAAAFGAFSILPAIFMVVNYPAEVGLPRYGETLAPDADRSGHPTQHRKGLTFAEAMRNGWFWVLYLMVALLGVYYAMGQITNPFFTNQQTDPGSGMTPALVATLMSFQMIGLILAKPILGAMIESLGLVRAMAIVMALHAVAGYLLGVIRYPAPWWISIVILLVGSGFAVGTLTPPLAGIAAFGQRDFPAIWGVLGTAYMLGLAVGTPLWSAAGTIGASPDQPWQLYRVALQWCWVLGVAVLVGYHFSIRGGRARQQPAS